MSIAVAAVVVSYLMLGVALAQLTWREIDRAACSTGHYWLSIALLIVAWPKAIYDIRKGRR